MNGKQWLKEGGVKVVGVLRSKHMFFCLSGMIPIVRYL